MDSTDDGTAMWNKDGAGGTETEIVAPSTEVGPTLDALA